MTTRKESPEKQKQAGDKRCANCFACKRDTELCPLNENYSPDAYLQWEERYLSRRSESKEEL